MQWIVIVAGLAADMVGWRLVAVGKRDVWRLMPWVLGVGGAAAALVRRPVWVHGVSTTTALGLGVGSGLALYAGTRVFVWIATLWPRFRADVLKSYGEAAEVSVAKALALSLLVMVPSEEVFWRGLVQGRLGVSMALGGAATLAWLGYILANVPSGSLPIVAGAVVGGALWSALAWWSGGVLASLASHILWTGAMLWFPPRAGRRRPAE